jgi:hypothetical protein
LGGESGGEREISAGDSLSYAEEVGANGFVFDGEHFAGSAETGGHFVADEQDVVFSGEAADFGEVATGMDDHAGGALNDGFDADSGNAR